MTYDFYDKMNSINTIDHLENLKLHIMKNGWWKRLILIWDNASYHVSQMVLNYINAQKDWLTIVDRFLQQMNNGRQHALHSTP